MNHNPRIAWAQAVAASALGEYQRADAAREAAECRLDDARREVDRVIHDAARREGREDADGNPLPYSPPTPDTEARVVKASEVQS